MALQFGYVYYQPSPHLAMDQLCDGVSGGQVPPVPSAPPTVWSIDEAISSTSEGKWLWVNGVLQGMGTGTTLLSYARNGAIGRAAVNTTAAMNDGRFQGDIAEIVVYTETLSDAERRAVEKYLRGHWNVPTPTWTFPENTPCLTAIASGWGIGCGAGTGGGYGIFRWSPETTNWLEIPASLAVTVNLDLNGNPWVANSSGQAYQWQGGPLFVAVDGPSTINLASGSNDYETWYVDSHGGLWNWTPQGVQQMASPVLASDPPGKVAVFSAATPDCGDHVPWYLGTSGTIGQVYRYQHATSTCDSLGGTFVPVPTVGAYDITTDLLAGSDGWVYRWDENADAFMRYVPSPFGTDTLLGSGVDGTFAAARSTGAVAQLVTPP
jgi:hypothetical protein